MADTVQILRSEDDIPAPSPGMFEVSLSQEDQASITQMIQEFDTHTQTLGLLAQGAAEANHGHYAVLNARGQHGVGEPEAYARYVRWFGFGGAPPWCAYFVGWCFDTSQAGNNDHKVPWGQYGGVGSTSSIHQWAQATGILAGKPEHGDIYGRSDQNHTGLVVGANPEGTQIYTINGNWSHKVGYAVWNKNGSQWVSGSEQIGLWFARY